MLVEQKIPTWAWRTLNMKSGARRQSDFIRDKLLFKDIHLCRSLTSFIPLKRVTIGPYLPQTMGQARRVERSSNHLKENRKRMVICPDQNKRVFFPNMAWSDIHWSETLKWSCLRNGVVCGFFFNAFTILCLPQCQCPHRWLETLNGPT